LEWFFSGFFRGGQVDLQPSNDFAYFTALLGSPAPSHQQCQIASSSPKPQHEIPITLQGKLFILNQFSQKKENLDINVNKNSIYSRFHNSKQLKTKKKDRKT
jgi:hypothetical protein